MGGLSRHVLRQIFFLFDTVIVLEQKKPRSSPILGGLLSQVFATTSLKRYFRRRSTKAAEAGSSRGHISAARTDPNTHDPPDRQHFLSRRVSLRFGAFFLSRKKKCQSIEKKSQCVNFTFTVFKTVFISV